MRHGGPSYLAYAIIDTIVDGYYPVIEALGDHLDQLEHEVVERPNKDVLRELNRTKNMLANLRRAVWPQRDAINSMIRDAHPLVTDKVRLFTRDTHDHCVQTAEVIEMYREMATGLMKIYLSSIANRTNEVMKVLTIMASIFIPLTFLHISADAFELLFDEPASSATQTVDFAIGPPPKEANRRFRPFSS